MKRKCTFFSWLIFAIIPGVIIGKLVSGQMAYTLAILNGLSGNLHIFITLPTIGSTTVLTSIFNFYPVMLSLPIAFHLTSCRFWKTPDITGTAPLATPTGNITGKISTCAGTIRRTALKTL